MRFKLIVATVMVLCYTAAFLMGTSVQTDVYGSTVTLGQDAI